MTDWGRDHFEPWPEEEESGMDQNTKKLVTIGGILLAAAVLAYYLEKHKIPVGGGAGATNAVGASKASPALPKPASGGGYRPPAAPAAPAPQADVPAYGESGYVPQTATDSQGEYDPNAPAVDPGDGSS